MKSKIRGCKFYIPLLLIVGLLIGSCTESTPEEVDESQKGVVFPNTEYSKVIAYHFEDLEGGHIIDKNGKLNPTVKKQKELNDQEVETFLSSINNNDTYGGMYTRCFKPRLGVVFYDNAEKAVAHISICFECSQQVSTPMIKAYSEADLGKHGYSEEGFRGLTSFCRKLGFGQCGE